MLRGFRWGVMGLILTAAMVICAKTQAQDNPPPRRPMMGFGGMGGGGMMQSPAATWGMLLRSDKVLKEIEALDDQKTKIKDLNEKGMAKVQEAMPDFRALRDMSQQDRDAKLADMRKKLESLADEQKKAYEEVLLPHQTKRLKEIAIQFRGVQALEDKEVQDSLKITEEQKEKFKKVREEMQQKAREMFQGLGRGDRDKMRERFQSFRKETEEKALAVLTSEQTEQFNKMKGEKFEVDMAELMSGFGRRPQEKRQ